MAAVGGYSKDRDRAAGGQAAGGKARGYKGFLVRGVGVVPDAWTPGAMNTADPDAVRELVPRLAAAAGAGGYLVADAPAARQQPAAPRLPRGCGLRAAGWGLRAGGCGLRAATGRAAEGRAGERAGPPPARPGPAAVRRAAGDPGPRPGTGPAPFARDLYALRGRIERDLGGWCSFGGGGPAPLPAWVRRPHRVAYGTAAKLVINGPRLCRLRGLAA